MKILAILLLLLPISLNASQLKFSREESSWVSSGINTSFKTIKKSGDTIIIHSDIGVRVFPSDFPYDFEVKIVNGIWQISVSTNQSKVTGFMMDMIRGHIEEIVG